MVRWRDEIGERRAKAGHGISLKYTLIGVSLFFVACILLNGDSLYRNAERLPYGPIRDTSLRLTAPLRWISRATQLYRFREWIERTCHKDSNS